MNGSIPTQHPTQLQAGDTVRVNYPAYAAWYLENVSPHGIRLEAETHKVRGLYELDTYGECANIYAPFEATNIPVRFLTKVQP
jgi:hypothetical protein